MGYFKDNGGIPKESAYPYMGQSSYYGSGMCSASGKVEISKPILEVKNYWHLTEAELKEDVYVHGPVGVALHAGHSAFYYPSSNG
jgi:hypothetical protein